MRKRKARAQAREPLSMDPPFSGRLRNARRAEKDEGDPLKL